MVDGCSKFQTVQQESQIPNEGEEYLDRLMNSPTQLKAIKIAKQTIMVLATIDAQPKTTRAVILDSIGICSKSQFLWR